jgi:hypothetical protein
VLWLPGYYDPACGGREGTITGIKKKPFRFVAKVLRAPYFYPTPPSCLRIYAENHKIVRQLLPRRPCFGSLNATQIVKEHQFGMAAPESGHNHHQPTNYEPGSHVTLRVYKQGALHGANKFRFLYRGNLPAMLFDIDRKFVYPMVFFKMLTGSPSGISKNLDRGAGLG